MVFLKKSKTNNAQTKRVQTQNILCTLHFLRTLELHFMYALLRGISWVTTET